MKCRLAYIILGIPLLFSCSVKQSSGEADADALARMQEWGVSLPPESTVVGRYYQKYDGWDYASYPYIYYCFSLSSEPAAFTDATAVNANEDYSKSLLYWIGRAKDSSGKAPFENALPQFDGEETYYLISGWRKGRVVVDADEKRHTTYQYSFVFEQEYVAFGELERQGEYECFARLHMVFRRQSMTLLALFQHWRS